MSEPVKYQTVAAGLPKECLNQDQRATETCSDYYKEGRAHQWSWRDVTGDQMTDEVPETGSKDSGVPGGTFGTS